MSEGSITFETEGSGRTVRFAGPVVVSDLEALRAKLATLPGAGPVTLDLAGAGAMDTAGAWLIVTLRRRLKAEGVETRLDGADAKQALLIETVDKALPTEPPPPLRHGGFIAWVAGVGEATAGAGRTLHEMTSFGGEIAESFLATLVRPWRLRVTALVHHMQDVGLNAVPIVSLMSFLIGVVLAFMGSVTLRAVRGRGVRGRSDRDHHPARARRADDGDHRRGAHRLQPTRRRSAR